MKSKKYIIISGSSSGLGKSLSENFIKDGHDMLLLYRKKIDKDLFLNLKKKNQKIIFFKLDLVNQKKIEKLIEFIKKNFKSANVLINNAADIGPIGLFHQNDFKSWVNNLTINLINTAFLIKKIIPIFVRKKSSIINISGGGSSKYREYFSAYSVSKTGIVRLTENLSKEYSNTRMNFFALAPGVMKTKMFKKTHLKKYVKNYKKDVSFTDPANSHKLITILINEKSNSLSGKLFSVKWDKWKNLNYIKKIKKNENLLTLRRKI